MYVDNSNVHHSHRDSGTKKGENIGNKISVLRAKVSNSVSQAVVSISFLLITRLLWDWGLPWVAPLVGVFVDWLGLLLSCMDNVPLSVGGGGSDAGPSSSGRPVLDLNGSPKPELDLNQPPAPEPEPEQQPNPYIGLGKEQIKEELKKNVKRIRFFQGMLNSWEREREKCIQKERERRERERGA